VDRHENVGEGHIGIRGFRLLLRHPALRKLPFILETPGFDGRGPDRRNILILSRLAMRRR
jgi:deoxyribonuclease-4